MNQSKSLHGLFLFFSFFLYSHFFLFSFFFLSLLKSFIDVECIDLLFFIFSFSCLMILFEFEEWGFMTKNHLECGMMKKNAFFLLSSFSFFFSFLLFGCEVDFFFSFFYFLLEWKNNRWSDSRMEKETIGDSILFSLFFPF